MVVIVIGGGCLIQEDSLRKMCVTPIRELSLDVSSGGISTTSDGSIFAVATGETHVFNNKGELLWTREVRGSSCALLAKDGKSVLIESYNRDETWKSTIVKVDSQGNILWERQTGLIGSNGLAVTPDLSFIAVGATDEVKKGHVMLFDGDGNKLWDHQLNWIVDRVAVSMSGYVVAGPRDRYLYVYNRHGEVTFTYFTGSWYDPQGTAIAPDETFFLFVSGHKYLNCYTLHGEFLWQKEMGDLCNVGISSDGEYIVAAAPERLFFLDKNGNELWSKKVSITCIRELTISDHGEYIAVDAEKRLFSLTSSFEIYSKEGTLLWQYEMKNPIKALVMSGDGNWLAASDGYTLLFFDNFQAIGEYALSECGQSMRVFTFSFL